VAVVAKEVVAQEVNMLPRYRGNLLEQLQKFLLLGGLAPVQQHGEQNGVVGDHHVRYQPAALIADGHVQIRPSRQMLFAADLREEGAEWMIRLDAVLGTMHVAL